MSGININLPGAFEQEVVYKECKHNHAASLGRVSYDGCREFLKGGDNGTKEAMLCAACGCHRSFHRKDTVYNPISQMDQNNNVNVNVNTSSSLPGPSAPRVALGNNPEAEVATASRRKKRTMFSAEQRNRMIRFAERLGWRPQRADKEEIQEFCMEMGISRRMFLVWLRNNRRRAVQKNTTTSG